MTPAARTTLLAPAGLLVGAALWAVATQAGQILPYLSCGSPWHPLALVALPSALAAVLAAGMSWRSLRLSARPGTEPSPSPASARFIGRISAFSGLLFAYALLLQGVSALVLSGCER